MKPQAQIEYRPLSELKELPGNPRTIKKDQFEKLKKSLQDNADYFEARHAQIHQKKGAREWQTSKTSFQTRLELRQNAEKMRARLA